MLPDRADVDQTYRLNDQPSLSDHMIVDGKLPVEVNRKAIRNESEKEGDILKNVGNALLGLFAGKMSLCR
jgi:hypothetical protein